MVNINLSTLVNENIDLISGRSLGEVEAEKYNVVDCVKRNEKIVIEIDDSRVKAINDSFIKGFFKSVFEELKTKKRVKDLFEIRGNEYFVKLFDKNWTILESIYSDAPAHF